MTLPTGNAEREIRDAVVARMRRDLPHGRVVHELNCGGRRADLAVIEPERLMLIEIKSEKDTLSRAKQQIECFSQSAHATIVVVHERHFDRTPHLNGDARCVAPACLPFIRRGGVWIYPEGADQGTPLPYDWRLPAPSTWQPHTRLLLELLWRAELVSAAEHHRVSIGSRWRVPEIIDALVWHMTGQEICRAACKALRERKFAYADPAIIERRAAA